VVHLGLDAGVQGLAGNAGGALHVLIAGVGARADEARLELRGPLVGLQRLRKLRQGVRQIGREGAVNLRMPMRLITFSRSIANLPNQLTLVTRTSKDKTCSFLPHLWATLQSNFQGGRRNSQAPACLASGNASVTS
jgi:hypothetical protein